MRNLLIELALLLGILATLIGTGLIMYQVEKENKQKLDTCLTLGKDVMTCKYLISNGEFKS